MKRFFSAVLVLAICIAATSAAFADSPTCHGQTNYGNRYPEIPLSDPQNPSQSGCKPSAPYIMPCCQVPTYDGLTAAQIQKCEKNKEWALTIAQIIKKELASCSDWCVTIVHSHGKTANGIVKLSLYNTKTRETIPEHYLFAYNGKYVAFSWEHVNNQKIADYDCLITPAGQSQQTALSYYYDWVLYGDHDRWSCYPTDDYDDYRYTSPTNPPSYYEDDDCDCYSSYPYGSYPCQPLYYTIKKGDTLWALAKRFGTTVEAIASLNGIKNPDKIYAGDTIRIR